MFNARTGLFYAANNSGAQVCQALAAEHDMNRIVSDFGMKCSISPVAAEICCREYIEKLIGLELALVKA